MSIDIARFDPAQHRDGLLALWRDTLHSATGKGHVLERRYEWLYDPDSPVPFTTWVALDKSKVVGCASMYQRRLWFAGKEHMVGTGCDFAVARSHRVAGPALALQRALVSHSLADGCEFLTVRPDDRSASLFRRVGYRDVGLPERWVRVLQPQRYTEDSNNAPLVVTASRLATKGLALVDQGLRLRHLHRLAGLRREQLDQADGRVDALWNQASDRAMLCEVRSAATLNWRYTHVPDCQHRFFYLLRRGTLLGYVVYSREGSVVNIEDLFACDHTARELLLVELINAMRRQGCSSISMVFMGNDTFRSTLRRLLFIKRQDLRGTLVFFHPDASDDLRQRVLSSRHAWLLFNGGMDL